MDDIVIVGVVERKNNSYIHAEMKQADETGLGRTGIIWYEPDEAEQSWRVAACFWKEADLETDWFDNPLHQTVQKLASEKDPLRAKAEEAANRPDVREALRRTWEGAR